MILSLFGVNVAENYFLFVGVCHLKGVWQYIRDKLKIELDKRGTVLECNQVLVFNNISKLYTTTFPLIHASF